MAAVTYIMEQREFFSFVIGQVMYRTFDVPTATLRKMTKCVLLAWQTCSKAVELWIRREDVGQYTGSVPHAQYVPAAAW